MKKNKGAHFYKCDFQVHSPRDLQWKGEKFGYPSERIVSLLQEDKDTIVEQRTSFAKDYLQKIRDKDLNAVAITDHHDVVFAKLIRRVAEEENKQFLEKGQAQKCITVFPGIEVSLSNPPCLSMFIDI
jgi:type III restriction enzyme